MKHQMEMLDLHPLPPRELGMLELKILISGTLELELKPNVCFLCFVFPFLIMEKKELASVVTILDPLTPALGRAIGELLNLLLKNSIGPLAQ